MRRVSFAGTANLVAIRTHGPARSIIVSICALVLATALVGCGGADTGNVDNDTGTPPEDVVDASEVSTDVPTATEATTPTETTVETETIEDVSTDVQADADSSTTADDADSSTTGDDADASTTTDDDADASTTTDDDADASTTTDDDADASTTTTTDAQDDAEVVVTPCSGPTLEAGCPCTGDNACDSGFCAIGPDGSTCVATCDADADCTGGATCVDSADGNGGVCLQPHDFLCLPCDNDAECRASGGTGRCLSFGAGGSFCGTTCGGDDQCPDAFYCLQGQCVPDSGTCDCTDVALELGASTTCRFTNAFGVCTGQRICGVTGLTACDARTPARDICDGIDQDCDNVPDDDATSCDDGNPCTQDVCGGANGCQHPPRTGAACSDNEECTINDQCQSDGTCDGDPSPALNCVCDEDADCEERVPNDLDEACVTAVCNTGACDFNPKAGDCSDNDACTTGDACSEGVCGGTTTDCDDDNPCTNDSCNALTGDCVNTARTGSCEDGDPCTTNDTCNGNTCEGQELDCSPLDDACHIGVCDGAGGCASQALTCGVSGLREHVPAAAFSRKGTGATWLEGSAGHGGPIGKSSNSIHTIHFGIHPGNR